MTAAATSGDRRPKWRRVLDDLEDRLAAGEFADRFPTDRELVDTYGVSRATVRQAVGRLAARGAVERQRGRGSVVTDTPFVQPLGTLYSLFRAVEEQGIEQTSEVLELGWRVDARAAERLHLPVTTPLFHLERLRLAGGEPLALDTVWLPPDLGEPLLEVDFGRTALYDELEARTGVRIDSGQEVIAPLVGDDDLRAVLEMDTDEAALRIERLGMVGERPVECRLTLLRGSRFALVQRWPDGPGVSPRLDDAWATAT